MSPAPSFRRAITSPKLVPLTLLVIIFLGFAARVWRLGAQSLWLDEALSVVFARPPVGEVISILINQDLHPPLYYLALHYWMELAGHGEFSARFLSVLFGLPIVPVTYALGAALFPAGDSSAQVGARPHETPSRGQMVGLVGALLVALSPFLVYYAQEARMYSALVTFGALSSLALWKFLRTRRRLWWCAFVLFTAVSLYTQYFALLVIGFQGLYLLGLLTRDRRGFFSAVAGLLTAGVLYLPWLPGAYRQMIRLLNVPDFWKGDFQLSYMVEHVFAAFALGHISALRESPIVVVVAGAAALLIALGLLFLIWRAVRVGGAALYLLGYLLVPFAALYLILLRNPKFTERYLIMIAPPFYLVLAFALVWLGLAFSRSGAGPWTWRGWRWSTPILSIGLGGALLVMSIAQVWQVYYGESFQKDDNRAAVAYIASHYQDGDTVILMMDTYQAFEYYSGGTIPWLGFQPGGDISYAARTLNQVTEGKQRLWLLLWNPEWADPSGWVRQSLDQAYPKLPIARPFHGLEVRLYQIDPHYRFQEQTEPSIAHPVNFGNQLQLLGYDLPQSTVAAGNTETITLYWKALQPITTDDIVSLRLTDGSYYWWRYDDRPARFNFATMYWKPGQVVTGNLEYQVPPGTPPGRYQLEVGVYPQGGGSDLNVLQDDRVPVGTAATLATIEVTRPSSAPNPDSFEIPQRSNLTFGNEVRLLGISLPTRAIAPGGTADLVLWWQALRAAGPDQTMRVSLESGGKSRILLEAPPVGGRYPTSQWQAGEVVVDRERLIVPADTPAGSHAIRLQLGTAGTYPSPSVLLGTLEVADLRRVTTAPSDIQHPVRWQIGQFAQLIGYAVSAPTVRPGERVQLTLYWRAAQSSGETAYTVFAHLLDHQNLVAAQQDHEPAAGASPTTGWLPGEYVTDHYDLILPGDAAPGAYAIEIGMYDPRSLTRLPVRDANGQDAGDRIILGAIQVK